VYGFASVASKELPQNNRHIIALFCFSEKQQGGFQNFRYSQMGRCLEQLM